MSGVSGTRGRPVSLPEDRSVIRKYGDLMTNAPERYTRTEYVVVGVSLLVFVLLLLVLGAVGER